MKRRSWSVDTIQQLVSYANTHSVKEACDRFKIKTTPQFYQLKARLEGTSQVAKVKAKGKALKAVVVKAARRGRPPKSSAKESTSGSSLPAGLNATIDRLAHALESLASAIKFTQSKSKK